MSGLANAIVLDPDPRAGHQLLLGFEREGVPARVQPVDEPLDLADPGVIVVGGALDLVRRVRTTLTEHDVDIPIVFTGTASRSEAEAAGADEVVTRPAFLRDLVTIAKLVRGVPAGHRDHLVGQLAETTGVYTLVRALAALGRSAVLTLIRGLRRGEIRFFRGEVTSAQVGLIHGQAAFHQLLLWTDARFDYQHEDIVRRHQIPLPPEELFADAERFLEGVREHAGALSPATVLEQDVQRVQGLGKQIPTEVHGVLRMFDGHRVLADILEDSPYRVFETLRVAQKAVDVGLLRPVEGQKKKATWRAVLAIEEWLVGNETREAVVERTSQLDITAPVPRQGKKKKRKKRVRTPPAGTPKAKSDLAAAPKAKSDIDWGALVPRIIGAEVGPLSGVVPAEAKHGEIELPTRDKPRERLEALMDTERRDRIFPTEIGAEPSVVVRTDDEPEDWDQAEWDAKARTLAEEKARAEAAAALAEVQQQHADGERARADAAAKDAEVRGMAETPPAGMPTVDPGLLDEPPAAAPAATPALDADALRASAPERVGESVERMRLDRLRREEAAAKEREEAERAAAADEAKNYGARAKAAAEARAREEIERKAAEAERAARADAAAAKLIATPTQPSPPAVDPATAVAAAPDAASPPRERTKPGTDARDLVKQLVADVVPANAPASDSAANGVDGESRVRDGAPITVAETPAATVQLADTFTVETTANTARVTASPTVTIREAAPTEPADPIVRALVATPLAPSTERLVAKPAADTKPAPTADPPVAKPAAEAKPAPAADALVAKPAAEAKPAPTADALVAKPAAEAKPAPATDAPVAAARPAATAAALVATPVASAVPAETDDEPSDGIVRAPVATVDTAKMRARNRRPTPAPEHDGPPQKEATGEIGHRTVVPRSAPVEQPSIVVEQLVDRQPVAADRTAFVEKQSLDQTPVRAPQTDEPSMLVSDLAAVHAAASAAAAPGAAPGNAATPSRELAVAEVRRDATLALTDAEAAFFNKAETGPVRMVKPESFDDLDEGYEPPKFWDRVFGRKKPPKR